MSNDTFPNTLLQYYFPNVQHSLTEVQSVISQLTNMYSVLKPDPLNSLPKNY